MFGRKARQIANQAVMIAKARSESHEYLSSLVAKNKQIIALNDAIQEHAQQIEDLRTKVTRAEGSADAAIQAGGIISDQLHAAQAALAAKDATIGVLSVEVDDLKVAKQKLSEALGQARAEIEQLRAQSGTTPGRRPQGVPPKVAPPPPPPKATPPGSQQ